MFGRRGRCTDVSFTLLRNFRISLFLFPFSVPLLHVLLRSSTFRLSVILRWIYRLPFRCCVNPGRRCFPSPTSTTVTLRVFLRRRSEELPFLSQVFGAVCQSRWFVAVEQRECILVCGRQWSVNSCRRGHSPFLSSSGFFGLWPLSRDHTCPRSDGLPPVLSVGGRREDE